MKPTKPIASLIALLLVLGIAPESYADISNAAVLYLRIAPGARAAAMGEAYVAIADDATTSHWNPAGLGAYPLADTWVEAKVPRHLRPLAAMASLKARGGSDYLSYDIWAVTAKGLARYDNKKWYLDEVFDTKTSETVQKIVASYFNLTDEARIAQVAEKVALANNEREFSYLEDLRQRVQALVPADYDDVESVESGFDTLLAAYNSCLINWKRVAEVEKLLSEGMKDSVLSEKETDRINFAVEKSKNRFIPEELIIPYSTLFDAELTAVASAGKNLLVGTRNGLFSYNGRRWQTFRVENGLPSNNVLCLASTTNSVFVGTERGLIRFDGMALKAVGQGSYLPEEAVTAIGASGDADVWAVINNELYHYDGEAWSRGRSYTVVLDDTLGKIANKFAIYGTTAEREKFFNLLYQLNVPAPFSLKSETVVGPSGVAIQPSSVQSSDPETSEVGSQTAHQAGQQSEEAVFAALSTEELPTEVESEYGLVFEPGTEITIPYMAEVKGDVNSIYAGLDGRLWLGSSYGVLYFDGDRWILPGYDDYTIEEGRAIDELLLTHAADNALDPITYPHVIRDLNDLDDEPVASGQTIKLYRNPTASPVRRIASRQDRVYFATPTGLIEYDGAVWSKVDLRGLDKADVVAVEAVDDELWFAGDDKIVTKANGKTDISMMYVKWLPELADDLYYAFLSVVSNKEGWGTFGGNITFISYGTINRTGEAGQDLGTFESFDIGFTGSYGTSLTGKLKGGISTKLLYSRLADQGAGLEQGKGTSTGFAVDFGLLYMLSRRLTLGMAVTNLGPDMAYIDAAQADALPRNLGLGFAYKLLQSDFYHFLVTAEVNKMLVGLDDGFREELKQLVLNGGAEFLYANILALRAGYIFDEEGDIKTVTLGAGLSPWAKMKFDFAYIPSNTNEALANTLRISLSLLP